MQNIEFPPTQLFSNIGHSLFCEVWSIYIVKCIHRFLLEKLLEMWNDFGQSIFISYWNMFIYRMLSSNLNFRELTQKVLLLTVENSILYHKRKNNIILCEHIRIYKIYISSWHLMHHLLYRFNFSVIILFSVYPFLVIPSICFLK